MRPRPTVRDRARVAVARRDRLGRRRPLIVFLHEGLGSLAMWRDFPQRAVRRRRLRAAWSTRAPATAARRRATRDEAWGLDFMHRQAHEVLPALLAALDMRRRDRPWLFGHSDGGSIALLYAARFQRALPARSCWRRTSWSRTCRCASIEQARDRLPRRPTCASAWPSTTTTPTPRSGAGTTSGCTRRSGSGRSRTRSARIACPLLAVQGVDDEYGTLEQIRGIARRVPQAQLLELADCGHTPAPRPAGCADRGRARLPARTQRRRRLTSLDGLRHLPHPVPERTAVRAAAVPGGLGPDADLRHHGRHQPGARQLLHDRRLHGVRAGADRAGHLRRRLLRDAVRSASCCR